MPMHNKDILSERRKQENMNQREVDKLDDLFEDIIVEDPYANSTDPIKERDYKIHSLVGFITQFNGHGDKQREEGVQIEWAAAKST